MKLYLKDLLMNSVQWEEALLVVFQLLLGSGPKAGMSGEDIYKNQKETDKKHRSKKSKNKSVQWYLQNI